VKRGRKLTTTKISRTVRRWPSLCLTSRKWRLYDFVMRGEFERWLIAESQRPMIEPVILATSDTKPVDDRWSAYTRQAGKE